MLKRATAVRVSTQIELEGRGQFDVDTPFGRHRTRRAGNDVDEGLNQQLTRDKPLEDRILPLGGVLSVALGSRSSSAYHLC